MKVNSEVGAERGQVKRRDYFGITIDVDPAGRRLWPAEVSQRIAAASLSSNLPVEQFAAEWDVNPSSLSKWRMAEKAGRAPKPPRKRTKAAAQTHQSPARAFAVCRSCHECRRTGKSCRQTA